jgi:hypothetical protein
MSGLKIDELDLLTTPALLTDERLVGRGSETFRTPLRTAGAPPTILGVIDSGFPRCSFTHDPLVWWDMAQMPQYVNGSESSWSDVIWVPSRQEFWAIAALNNGGNRNVIAVSKDGVRWSGRANDATTVNTGIAFAPTLGTSGRFCICRQAGSTTSNRIWTSDDGFTWTERALPTININGLACIAWSPALSLFVVMGSSNTVFTSPDGITWTSRTGPTSGGAWRRVLWAAAHAKFYAFDGNSAAQSADGINWGAVSSVLPGNGRGWAFSESLGVLVATDANNNSTIKHSTNGTSWTSHTVTGTFHGIWQDVVWSEHEGKFIAVGGFQIAHSPDGNTWTVVSNSPFPQSSGVNRLCVTR